MKYCLANFLSKNLVSLLVIFFLVACCSAAVVWAQNSPAPTRSEKLLNGLCLLIWAEPNNPVLTVKLRIHSGAAFDPKGKEGVMSLLGDIMFNEQTKSFFRDELGGDIKTEVNQDFIEITATGSPNNFERILDTVRIAVTNPPITPENVKKAQAARMQLPQGKKRDWGAIADAAVRKRLFGEFFPYGRMADGNAETWAKIDRADLLLARERFLTADNATLAIIGDVDPKYTLRAVKQFFGAWSKADKPTPPTFRQPETPDSNVLTVKFPNTETGQIRFALRGLARNSADFGAAEILANILQERWRDALPEGLKQKAFVRHEAHVLPGIVIFGASVEGGFAESYLDTAQAAFKKILSAPVSDEEFNKWKNSLSMTASNGLRNGAIVADSWLDADTYKLGSVTPNSGLNNIFTSATLAQAQSVLANWQKQTPAAVIVTQAEGNVPMN